MSIIFSFNDPFCFKFILYSFEKNFSFIFIRGLKFTNRLDEPGLLICGVYTILLDLSIFVYNITFILFGK